MNYMSELSISNNNTENLHVAVDYSLYNLKCEEKNI